MGLVMKAAGKILGGTAKFAGRVALGGVQAAGDIAFQGVKDGIHLGRTVAGKSFKNTVGVKAGESWLDKDLGELGHSYMENLREGQIIPFKLKTPVAVAAIGLAAGAGVTGGIMGASDKEGGSYEDPNVMQAPVPNTIDRHKSPYNNGVDNLGADGDLVFALHNKR